MIVMICVRMIPIEVTLAGIVTDVSSVHNSNAF